MLQIHSVLEVTRLHLSLAGSDAVLHSSLLNAGAAEQPCERQRNQRRQKVEMQRCESALPAGLCAAYCVQIWPVKEDSRNV